MYSKQDLAALPSRFRAHLINSLTGYKGLVLCGTQDGNGVHNLSLISSVVHLGSNPPLYGMVMRPDTVRRDTLDNIRTTKCYTFNHVTEAMYFKAHQASAKYDANESEFKEVGLTPDLKDNFAAPAVAESVIQLGLKLVREIPIVENGTLFIIGELQWANVPSDYVAEDGYVSIADAGTVTVAGLDGYHLGQKLSRLSYAKKGVDIDSQDNFLTPPASR